MTPTQGTLSTIRRVLDALDLVALGRVYCDYGGDEFWADRRGPVLDLGVVWAAELSRHLRRGGTSLYVGAGVAEIPAMLVEALDLGREVVACNLRSEECAIVNAALKANGLLMRIVDEDAGTIVGGFDHVSLVSVLCDPQTYPLVSEVTYGRVHPVHVDAAAFATEQAAINQLVAKVLARLHVPGLVTTTVEEVPWILAWAEQQGIEVIADDNMLETAVVGDPIGFLQLARPTDS